MYLVGVACVFGVSTRARVRPRTAGPSSRGRYARRSRNGGRRCVHGSPVEVRSPVAATSAVGCRGRPGRRGRGLSPRPVVRVRAVPGPLASSRPRSRGIPASPRPRSGPKTAVSEASTGPALAGSKYILERLVGSNIAVDGSGVTDLITGIIKYSINNRGILARNRDVRQSNSPARCVRKVVTKQLQTGWIKVKPLQLQAWS